jgi:hypothetical protein
MFYKYKKYKIKYLSLTGGTDFTPIVPLSPHYVESDSEDENSNPDKLIIKGRVVPPNYVESDSEDENSDPDKLIIKAQVEVGIAKNLFLYHSGKTINDIKKEIGELKSVYEEIKDIHHIKNTYALRKGIIDIAYFLYKSIPNKLDVKNLKEDINNMKIEEAEKALAISKNFLSKPGNKYQGRVESELKNLLKHYYEMKKIKGTDARRENIIEICYKLVEELKDKDQEYFKQLIETYLQKQNSSKSQKSSLTDISQNRPNLDEFDEFDEFDDRIIHAISTLRIATSKLKLKPPYKDSTIEISIDALLTHYKSIKDLEDTDTLLEMIITTANELCNKLSDNSTKKLEFKSSLDALAKEDKENIIIQQEPNTPLETKVRSTTGMFKFPRLPTIPNLFPY